MTDAAPQWPGQEITPAPQWPGQQQRGQGSGEYGFAATTPPEQPPKVPDLSTIGDIEASHPGETDAPAWMSSRPPPSRPYTALPLFPSPPAGAIGRIGAAAEEGYEGGQVLAPGNLWAPLVNPLLGAAGGIVRGGQQFLTEALPGGLGNELAAMVEAFPEGGQYMRVPGRPPIPGSEARIPFTERTVPFMHGASPGEVPPATVGDPSLGQYGPPPPPGWYGPPPNPLAPAPMIAPPFMPPGAGMPPLQRILDLLGADERMAANKPAMIPPATVTDVEGNVVPVRQPPNPLQVPQPRIVEAGMPPAPEALPGEPTPTPPQRGAPAAAGAQLTPSNMLGLTPDEELAYRSTAEGQKLIETQQPGIADNRQLVPGVLANTVEIEQTAQAARELKALKIASPAINDEALAISDANNTARQLQFQKLAGSDVQLKNAIDDRAAQVEADLKTTWASKQDVSPQPVLDTAKQILSGEDGRRPAVRNAVNSVTRELTDDNGNLITDPQILYGVRKHIGDLLSKEGAITDPLAQRAKANLLQLRDSLDGVITAGAPYFPTYLKNFQEASRPIDAMRVLQDNENGLYGTANRMEYGRFQRFMRKVVDGRTKDPVSPYNSISPDTLQQLWDLRDDLRRSNAAVELARTSGSDTAQNLMDLARHGLARGLGAAIGAVVGAPLGHLGMGVGASVGAQAGENFIKGRTERVAYQRGQQVLYPQNQLSPPAP